LTLTGIREYRKPLLAGAGLKLLVLPLVGGALLRWAGVDGLEFRVGMMFFALPISPATYVLSAQLHSDSRLAAAAIVTTTALSVIPLATILTLFG
jgi:predicted permease